MKKQAEMVQCASAGCKNTFVRGCNTKFCEIHRNQQGTKSTNRCLWCNMYISRSRKDQTYCKDECKKQHNLYKQHLEENKENIKYELKGLR